MRQTLTIAPGADTIGATLPDGSGAVAVQVDNPSGAWYETYPGGGTIPPYTQGFVVAFASPAPSIDVRYLPTGPAGQVSTLTGDALTVTLFDATEAPPASTGTPFITGFTGIQSYTLSVIVPLSTGLFQTIISPVPGKRIRLLTVDVWVPTDAGCVTTLQGTTAPDHLPVIVIGVRWDQPAVTRGYPNGFDFRTGDGIEAFVSPTWADAAYNLQVSYQVI